MPARDESQLTQQSLKESEVHNNHKCYGVSA